MPLIKSAIKKLRKDRIRTIRNKKQELALKILIKKARLDARLARVQKSPESLKAVSSALDKAAKTHLIHRKKASRLKSRLSKRVPTISKKKTK